LLSLTKRLQKLVFTASLFDVQQ